jgi:TRAP transporter TAXI family solute receptor
MVCFLLSALFTVVSGAAAATNMGIVTGSEKGTYYQFGLNLQQLGKEKGFPLQVYPSRGSIENIHAVYQRPGVQLGIAQADVLAFVARVQSDPSLKRVARKTKLVFPLYNEEVHLLVRRSVADFDDLADRRVAIGREGSGTYLTARLLFKVAEITPREMVPIDTEEALAELKAGHIDAMFYVAGLPVKLFTEQVTAADGLRFLPITNKSITEFYPEATISADAYPWNAEAVPTVAVKAVLMSFDYRQRDCENVGRFAQLVADNLEWLRQNGHAKWKSVDLTHPLKGWEQYDCVQRYLRKQPTAGGRTTRNSANPIMDAIRDVLNE